MSNTLHSLDHSNNNYHTIHDNNNDSYHNNNDSFSRTILTNSFLRAASRTQNFFTSYNFPQKQILPHLLSK